MSRWAAGVGWTTHTQNREVNSRREEACTAEITQNPAVLHLPAGTMKKSENNILFLWFTALFTLMPLPHFIECVANLTTPAGSV